MAATTTASHVNGNAAPSLMPASAVSEKRTWSSSPSCGPATCTSLASTGSVGAMAAPSNKAEAGVSPSTHQPSPASAAIQIIMVTEASSSGTFQLAQVKARSSRMPVPISVMMTAVSARWMVAYPYRLGSAAGSSHGRGSQYIRAPNSTNTMA